MGISTAVKPLQPLNALLPINVTELGISTAVKPLQPANASLPIDVTEYVSSEYVTEVGIVTEPVYS